MDYGVYGIYHPYPGYYHPYPGYYHPVPTGYQPLPSCTTPRSHQMGIYLVTRGTDLGDPWYGGIAVYARPYRHIPDPGITDEA